MFTANRHATQPRNKRRSAVLRHQSQIGFLRFWVPDKLAENRNREFRWVARDYWLVSVRGLNARFDQPRRQHFGVEAHGD